MNRNFKKALRKSLLMLFIVSAAVRVEAQSGQRVAVLWVDPLKNIEQLTTRRGILDLLSKASESGFQAVALGVKTNNGRLIYESDISSRLLEWKGKRIPLDFDIVNTFLEEGRNRGLQVYALFPVLAEGDMIGRTGTLYDEHPEWQTTVYVVENETPQVIPITQWGYGPVAFANPLNPAVQNHQIAILKELLDKYSFDGIVLDKIRFSGIEADFSDQTKNEFQRVLGQETLDWWPEDVLEWQFVNEIWEPVPGKHFHRWIEFRAKSIQSLVTKIVTEIKEIEPSLPIGNFVGAWYPTYYEYGVNWASESMVPEEEWATREYNRTAIAEKLDYSVVGCFFPRVSTHDAENVGADWWMSVEGSATNAMEVINKVTPVYGAILAAQFPGNEEQFKASLDLTLKLTDGLYITDASHIERHKFWDEIKAALNNEETTNSKGVNSP